MQNHKRPISQQLDAYEEGWKGDHDDAMRCRDFEEWLAVGISIFHVLVHFDELVRSRVRAGKEAVSDVEDEARRNWFVQWLRPCEAALEAVRRFEASFGSVEGAEEFRQCCEEANEIVAEWQPSNAQPPSLPSLEERSPANIAVHTTRTLTTAEMSEALDLVCRPTSARNERLLYAPED